ncbi:uncharacterized protein [Drosophila tropicalis]|uniref:uncharacterized protein n=1 Tax=Drosophila tropicalis TaxID=46794 RepID=UPI0035ABF21A
MLTDMAMRLALSSKLRPSRLSVPVAFFHRAVALHKEKMPDYRLPSDCPVTEETICKPLKKRRCSPTDPPVRPCSEEDCIPLPRYPCCVNTRISNEPCAKSGKKADFKIKPEPFVSMWEQAKGKPQRPDFLWDYPPECCPKCEDVRFDVLYYRPSDKCRKYQRTWWECCPRMVPKRVCSWCDAVPPQILRRCMPLCPRSACTNEHEKKRMDCINKKAKDCMRLRMPCCRAARNPPTCGSARRPSNCEKIRCPFPSFSECISEELAHPPERPGECRCLDTMSLCERNRYADRLAKHSIKMTTCLEPC